MLHRSRFCFDESIDAKSNLPFSHLDGRLSIVRSMPIWLEKQQHMENGPAGGVDTDSPLDTSSTGSVATSEKFKATTMPC